MVVVLKAESTAAVVTVAVAREVASQGVVEMGRAAMVEAEMAAVVMVAVVSLVETRGAGKAVVAMVVVTAAAVMELESR